MALGERFRSGGARGITQFLAEHQHCDSGFSVRREEAAGSGKLTITCQGCGKTVSYNASEVGEIGAFDLPEEGPTRRKDRAPIDRVPDGATGANGAEPPVGSESGGLATPGPGPRSVGGRRSGRGLPRWVAPAAIGLVIAAGVAMIAVGLSRSGNDGEMSEEPPALTQAETPAEPTTPTETTSSETTPTEPTTPEEPAPPAEPPPTGGVTLQNRSFEAFTVGVPSGWTASMEADGPTLEAPGSNAGLTVLAGGSTLSPLEFARQSEGFLATRREGASVADPKAIRFQGRPAARTIVTYPGAEEQVTFVSSGDTLYVLIKRIARGASARVEGEADAALVSFSPR